MKKRIALLMISAMFISAVSACSGVGGTESAAPSASPSASVSAQPTQSAAPTDDSQPPVKPEAYTLPLFEQTVELSAFYPLRSSVAPTRESGENVFWSRLSENLNVNITWREPSSTVANEQFNLMVASGEMTDLIFENMSAAMGSSCAYTGGYDAAIADNVYQDLTDYVAEYAPNYNYLIKTDPEIYKNVATDEGHIASFATLRSEPRVTNLGVVVNSDYMKATGLEIPETVEGWTKVFETMKANGVKYPCDVDSGGSMLSGTVSAAMGASLTNTFLIDVKSDELVYGPTTDQTKAYVELFREYYQAGYVDPDFPSLGFLDFTKFREGAYGTSSAMGNMLDTYYDQYKVNVTACPVIHADGAESGQVLIGDISSKLVSDQPGIAVTTACKELESVLKVCDWLYSDAGFVASNYGWVEGETYTVKDGEHFINDFYDAPYKNTPNIGNRAVYTLDWDAGYVYPNCSYDVGSETLKHADDIWTSDPTNATAVYYSIPTGVKLTSNESESISSKLADLNTYRETTLMKWLTCQEDFNDASWNEFVTTCQSMNLDEMREIYKAAYDRYMAK